MADFYRRPASCRGEISRRVIFLRLQWSRAVGGKDSAGAKCVIRSVPVIDPNAARLILSPIWGWLFDHLNSFILRVILNLGFAVGILTFFTRHDLKGLIFAEVVFGISCGRRRRLEFVGNKLEIKLGRAARRAPALVEEVSE